jgi:histidinol dehydrogenase
MVKRILKGFDPDRLIEQFNERGYSPAEVTDRVGKLIEAIAVRGDEALCEFTRQFDRVDLRPAELSVSPDEIQVADRILDPDLVSSMEVAAERIRAFHEAQRQKSWQLEEPGGVLGQQIRPIRNVGVYAPGGTAVLFSTLLMNVIPAQVAGCPRIAIASPPQSRQGGALNPTTLTACHLLRQQEVYRIGGAQAIAALALGTETIPRVDMICGPGNIYVTEAKRQLQGKVRIDSLAGPTEVVIIADEKARADFIAADLLAQLEHDASAAAMLLTPAEILLGDVEAEIERQKKNLQRQSFLAQSIDRNCYLVQTRSIEDALAFSDRIAPEHLELMIADPMNYVRFVQNAGAIFLGPYTPEAMGDYIAGPNHVLPTGKKRALFVRVVRGRTSQEIERCPTSTGRFRRVGGSGNAPAQRRTGRPRAFGFGSALVEFRRDPDGEDETGGQDLIRLFRRSWLTLQPLMKTLSFSLSRFHPGSSGTYSGSSFLSLALAWLIVFCSVDLFVQRQVLDLAGPDSFREIHHNDFRHMYAAASLLRSGGNITIPSSCGPKPLAGSGATESLRLSAAASGAADPPRFSFFSSSRADVVLDPCSSAGLLHPASIPAAWLDASPLELRHRCLSRRRLRTRDANADGGTNEYRSASAPLPFVHLVKKDSPVFRGPGRGIGCGVESLPRPVDPDAFLAKAIPGRDGRRF